MKAAEEEAADELVRSTVLEEVSLRHPVAYDMFNLCDMFKSRKLNHPSLSMLGTCTVCDHFHLDIDHKISQKTENLQNYPLIPFLPKKEKFSKDFYLACVRNKSALKTIHCFADYEFLLICLERFAIGPLHNCVT